MGVYLPNMEIPASCRVCKVEQGDFGYWWCGAMKKFKPTGDFRESRPDWCPAIFVPPHGRLGDLDAAAELVMQYCPDDDGTCSKAGVDLRELLDEIENLPTIIQAETFGKEDK